MGKIKVHVGLLGILLVSALLLILPSLATAQTLQLQPLLPPLPQVSPTVNSLGLPVQLGTSQSGLPTVPAIDPNSVLNQTTTDVNSLGLPVQLPQVDLGLPTVPAVNPEQVVGDTVNQVNNTVDSTVPLPVNVPNPLDLVAPPGSGGGLLPPGLPGLPGTSGAGGLPGLPGLTGGVAGSGASMGPSGITGQALGGIPLLDRGNPRLSGMNMVSASARGTRGGSGVNLAPAAPPNGSNGMDPLSTGLVMLPLLGILCVFLAVAAYLRSARHVWQARKSDA